MSEMNKENEITDEQLKEVAGGVEEADEFRPRRIVNVRNEEEDDAVDMQSYFRPIRR